MTHPRSAAVAVLAGCSLLAGCSRQFLSLFLDIPEPTPAPVQVAAQPAPTPLSTLLHLDPDTVRPPIEGTLDPDSAVALLPRDPAGNIDWMEALRSGVIKPRSALPDSQPPLALPPQFTFAFDFYFKGPAEQLDAFFPHSSHTQWVDCRQCHGRVFKYQDNTITMAGIFQGEWCGSCHGKVAFPPVTDCERCHRSLPMPPNRAQPELLGTITMARLTVTDSSAVAPAAAPDSASGSGDSTTVAASGAAEGAGTPPAVERAYGAESLPPAKFPHWVHRIRYTCKTCHLTLFEPKAGANHVTMTDISEGRACGACHDGITAFAAGFNECQRCHVPAPPPAPTPGAGGADVESASDASHP
ncbi:MAG: cytochrome c3 family protein [Gemmatimonadota bacterium]